MKAIGIVLIVYDHIAGSTINFIAPPILPKQLGVSFFLFVLAYVLARESRPVWEVVTRRLFTLYLVGVGFAVVLSICGIIAHGRPELSNYLPFLFGANVLLLQNDFPANPTTWYIATYVHVVLIWALVGHRFRVQLWMIPCAAVGEIGMRIMLADVAGPFVAYMALPNWLTVLFWGAWVGRRAESAVRAEWAVVTSSAVILTVLLVLWPVVGAKFNAYPGFPFQVIGTDAPLGMAVYASAMVTVLYVAYADCGFQLTRFLPAPMPAQFLARNTLVIFIGHMPVVHALEPILEPRLSFWVARGTELLICLLVLGLASELMFRAFNPEALRARLFSMQGLISSAAQER